MIYLKPKFESNPLLRPINRQKFESNCQKVYIQTTQIEILKASSIAIAGRPILFLINAYLPERGKKRNRSRWASGRRQVFMVRFGTISPAFQTLHK